jgi:hypothetical protein
MMNEQVKHEPSMNEILASIRQILSDPSDKRDEYDMRKMSDEDILDLTHLLPDEANSSISFKKQEKIALKSAKKELHQPIDPTLKKGSVSLDQQDLMRLLKEKREIPANASKNFEGTDQSFENMVRETLKPLVKDWLDAHLPSLIREITNDHIEKMVRQFVLK